MTFNPIIGLTVQALSQRNVNLDLDSLVTQINDLTGTVAAQFVNLGHLKLQRGRDFDCMDLPLESQLYTTGGLVLPAGVKRVYAAYFQATGGAGQPVAGAPIWPANKQDAVRVGLDHRGHGRFNHGEPWIGRGEYPGGTSALDYQPGGLAWWQRGNKLVLGRPAGHSDDSAYNGRALYLETFSYLPDYVAGDDSDWFSEWGADVLVLEACLWSGLLGQRDERLPVFKAELMDKLGALIELDQRAAAGGQADMVVAPVRGYRTRR